MTELETMLMKFVGRLLHLQLLHDTVADRSTKEFLESRKIQACALTDELVGKFFMTYQLKDETTQYMIRRQLRDLSDHEDDSVEAGVATVSLHHLLFNTPYLSQKGSTTVKVDDE